MAEPSADNAILLVTGATLTAEVMDRPLAYRLKERIDQAGDAGAGRVGIVLSDIWYLNNEPLHERPVISVGGPGVNALSQYLWRRLPGALVVEGVFYIQQDVTGQDLRTSIWGMDHETTVEAVELYIRRGYLDDFIRAAWPAKS
jgi:hypothetical protein